MALQQSVCCFTVVVIFFCKGCHSEPPACGIRAVNSSNITGPHDATPGSWPWFADIYIFSDGTLSFIFPGSLINDQWVLTDAYLPTFFQSSLLSMVVYLGSNTQSGSNPNEVNRTVVNITCHPDFNSETLENDICLLKLSAPVTFTDYIRPICLASENSTYNNETSSWAMGYTVGFSTNLQEANVPIVENNVCKSTNPWTSTTDNIICSEGTSFCLNTFGAPLMTQSESVWLQIGVLSGGGCSGYPSLYTRVSQYQKWINTVTGTLQTTAPLSTPPTSPPNAPPTSPPTTNVPPTTTAPLSILPTSPPNAPPTTHPTSPPTAPPTAPPTSLTCNNLFCSGANLIHFTHFTSLCVLVVLLHVFAGTVGK